jgi:hypothetical protein
MPTQEVLKDGTIVPKVNAPDHPGPIAQVVPGSAIQAAAAAVNDKTDTQAEAISVLGAKVGGRSRRHRAANLRRVMKMMRMRMRGGAEVEVKNVPNMPSAGGVDPKATFGKMLEVQHQAAADAQFDDLGTAAPKVLPPAGGRRRTKKKTLKHKKKHHGSGTKHRRVRKHRGSSRRTLRVRRDRR